MSILGDTLRCVCVFFLFSGVFCGSIGMARGPSQLVLSPQFLPSKLPEMPCSSLPPGLRYHRREYAGQRAFEWQLRLRAPSSGTPPLYERLRSADFTVVFPVDRPITVHWNTGSHAEVTDFQPHVETLKAGVAIEFESFGGRSSDGVLPYFNLATEGGGLIVAIGWSGDWKASFKKIADGRVYITAGLKRSRFRLRPSEEVRLPSILILCYQGSWLDGQNEFRRLMLQEFTPKAANPMQLMPVAASVHGIYGLNETSEKNLTELAGHLASLKLPLDTFWLDAGWNEGGFPNGQGNPNPAPERLPHGLAGIGKVARQANMRFLVWFEPERAMRGTWLDREHPEWLLLPSGTPPSLRYLETDGFRLLDLGNTDARRWAIDVVSQQIARWGVSIYRHDCNLYPAFFWHTDERPDAIGLREVRYVTGLYEFLDELARRHPGLILDNCASGGRRLDFEMMRRCVVLWRSDNCWDDPSFPRNVQAMTYGLSLWLPLHGLGAHTTDAVSLRSGMGACASFAVNFTDKAAVASLREHLKRYLPLRHLFAADFYPLTEWTSSPSRWLAYQFHDSAKGQGVVQAFCGAGSEERLLRLKLKGLDPNKCYSVTDWDGEVRLTRCRGSELMEEGIVVIAREKPRAIVLEYAADP